MRCGFGSTTVLTAPERRFRSTPMNGHHQVGPVGPVRANIRSREAKRPAVVPEAFWSEFGNSRRRIALLLPAKQKRGTKEGFVYCRCERPVPPRALDIDRESCRCFVTAMLDLRGLRDAVAGRSPDFRVRKSTSRSCCGPARSAACAGQSLAIICRNPSRQLSALLR